MRVKISKRQRGVSSNDQVVKDVVYPEQKKREFKTGSQIRREKRETALRWDDWESSSLKTNDLVGPSSGKAHQRTEKRLLVKKNPFRWGPLPRKR